MRGEDFIERRIATGLIVSTEYVRRVRPFWDDDYIGSPEVRRIASWCFDYFDRYDRAPGRDVQSLYYSALRTDQMPKDEAELVHLLLERISDEFERSDGEAFNVAYLFDQTVEHIRDREVRLHAMEVEDLRERGRIAEAEALGSAFVPFSVGATRGLEVGSEEGYAAVERAFAEGARPLVRYPGALGAMVNSALTRGGFVAFLAPEKRGKTFTMIDLAFRALRQKSNVAFFQAGDLTEGQALRRVAIYLSHRNDQPQYCQPYWRPVGDCELNQHDDCSRPDRNCDFGVYEDEHEQYLEDPTAYQNIRALSAVAERFADYRPCDASGCSKRRPCVWLVREEEREPLTGPAASRSVRKFFERYRRRVRLATYPNDTLTVAEISSCLDEWERQSGFVPDVIIVDYADLMVAPDVREFRHRQDAIWKGLRGLSQKRHALVVTATQADADSYRSSLLKLSNFAEDKRKYGHVTAMWGLNQDPSGREKDLGILRINELVVRDGATSVNNVVTVLQDLRSGRPYLESYSVGQNNAYSRDLSHSE